MLMTSFRVTGTIFTVLAFTRNMAKLLAPITTQRIFFGGGEWVGGLGQRLGGWGGVMSVCVVSLDSLYGCIYVYCAKRILAHRMCTQCSMLLHLIDIFFLTCICLWQISQIQTCLREVIGPGLVSTSPPFMRSIASHPVGPHGRLCQKTVIGGRRHDTICTVFARPL